MSETPEDPATEETEREHYDDGESETDENAELEENE